MKANELIITILLLLMFETFSSKGDEDDKPRGQVFVHGRDDPLELSDILPRNNKIYDKMRPPKLEGNATKVYFHVTVMSLDTIDESSMTYTCDIFFAQSWKDFRLRLPDNMTSEYRLLPVEWLTEIWRPDSFFKNAKSVTFQTMTIPNHYIWLYQDKSILYMVKLTLVLSCAMNFKNYPHDEQICNLKIESISHTTDDLVFEWDPLMPLDVDRGIELPQLELTHNYTGDCTTAYSTGNFTCLEVVFKFKRRLGYYLFHTYLPTCLIVIMSWISFWIKPEAVPARVTLGVTSLLTLSTQHANSQKSLPPVSYIKAIDVFMSGCTVFVFLSLMEYALVNIVMGDIADIEKKRFLEKKKTIGLTNLLMGARAGTNLHQMTSASSHAAGHAGAGSGGGGAQEKLFSEMAQDEERKDLEGENGYNNLFEDAAKMRPKESTSSFSNPNMSEATSNGRLIQGGGGQNCVHRPSGGQFGSNQPPASMRPLHNTYSSSSYQGGSSTLERRMVTGFHGQPHHHHHNSPVTSAHQAPSQPTITSSGGNPVYHHHHLTYQQQQSGGQPGNTAPSNHAPGTIPPKFLSKPNAPVNPGLQLSEMVKSQAQKLSQEAQNKRQKEIRDLMKKRREKAVLVDRISRWLFPTSFILLNIVYWALFGDHGLW